MNEDELLRSLGIEFRYMRETNGERVAENMDRTLACLLDESLPVSTRVAIASSFKTWALMVDAEVKAPVMMNHGPALLNVVAEVLLKPDDNDYDKDKGYSKVGLQSVAEEIVNAVQFYRDLNEPYAPFITPYAFQVLDRVSGVSVKDSTPLRSEGPAISRGNIINYLMRFHPRTGSIGDIPNAVSIAVRYIFKEPKSTNVQREAVSLLQFLSYSDQPKLIGHSQEIFECMKRKIENAHMILLSCRELYPAEPDIFHQNLDLLFQYDFITMSTIFFQISQSHAEVLAPHFDFFVQKTTDVMAIMSFQIIKNIAGPCPAVVYPALSILKERAFAVQQGDIFLVSILGSCGRISQQHSDEMMVALCSLLRDPRLSAVTFSILLNEINNLIDSISSLDVLTPYIDAIKSKQDIAQQVVQNILDRYAGRTLQVLDARIDEVEKKIEELNDLVKTTCLNFEDVKRYVDENISQVKDFVGTIVKKLPMPTRLVIVGTLRKTLKLHFPCCRQHSNCCYPYTREFTVESKDWNKWLKIGFTVIKLGKCVLDLGLGNPFGILKAGVDAIQEVYGHYKSKDDADFNDYIREPFLTSKQQDELLEKLKESTFFDEFEYDAQLAGWCCKACLPFAGESERKILIDQSGQSGLGEVERQKGKYGGFSTSDITDVGASVTSFIIGNTGVGDLSVDGKAVGDIYSTTQDVIGVVQTAVDVGTQMRDDYEEKKGELNQQSQQPQQQLKSQSPKPKSGQPQSQPQSPQSQSSQSLLQPQGQSMAVPDDIIRKIESLEKDVLLLNQEISSLKNSKQCCSVS